MFSLIEICCTYVAYRKMLILGKIGPDSSRGTSEIARNQKVNKNRTPSQVFLNIFLKSFLKSFFSRDRFSQIGVLMIEPFRLHPKIPMEKKGKTE